MKEQSTSAVMKRQSIDTSSLKKSVKQQPPPKQPPQRTPKFDNANITFKLNQLKKETYAKFKNKQQPRAGKGKENLNQSCELLNLSFGQSSQQMIV